MDYTDLTQLQASAGQALDLAVRHGADAADVVVVSGHATSASVRLGKLEDVERSESSDLGLRVFCGKSQAIVSTSRFDDEALDEAAPPARNS